MSSIALLLQLLYKSLKVTPCSDFTIIYTGGKKHLKNAQTPLKRGIFLQSKLSLNLFSKQIRPAGTVEKPLLGEKESSVKQKTSSLN